MKSGLFRDYFHKRHEFNITKSVHWDADFSFQQCSFLSEFHILLICLLPMHRILRVSFLEKISRFIRVLSKMEYIKIICTGGSKMADASNHDITVMDIHVLYIIYNQLPWFYQRPYYLGIFRFMSTLREIWILSIYSTIWHHNDVR